MSNHPLCASDISPQNIQNDWWWFPGPGLRINTPHFQLSSSTSAHFRTVSKTQCSAWDPHVPVLHAKPALQSSMPLFLNFRYSRKHRQLLRMSRLKESHRNDQKLILDTTCVAPPWSISVPPTNKRVQIPHPHPSSFSSSFTAYLQSFQNMTRERHLPVLDGRSKLPPPIDDPAARPVGLQVEIGPMDVGDWHCSKATRWVWRLSEIETRYPEPDDPAARPCRPSGNWSDGCWAQALPGIVRLATGKQRNRNIGETVEGYRVSSSSKKRHSIPRMLSPGLTRNWKDGYRNWVRPKKLGLMLMFVGVSCSSKNWPPMLSRQAQALPKATNTERDRNTQPHR